jgi:hypothetical protein
VIGTGFEKNDVEFWLEGMEQIQKYRDEWNKEEIFMERRYSKMTSLVSCQFGNRSLSRFHIAAKGEG